MAFFNPFCSQEAISHSNYCTLQQKAFTSNEPRTGRMKQETQKVASKLSDFVAQMKKPSQELGLTPPKRNCSFGVYPALATTKATAGLCRDLAHFLHEHKESKTSNTTFMAVFVTPSQLSEKDFHKRAMDQLSLLLKATEPFYCVPESIKHKLQEDEQTIFFGGSIFKVVSIYRNNSQGQLKFDYPMLAFSLVEDDAKS